MRKSNRPKVERNGKELRRKETFLKRKASNNLKIKKILEKCGGAGGKDLKARENLRKNLKRD